MNIKQNTVERKVEFANSCYGISYNANKLFVIITNGIVILDIAGKVLEILTIESGLCLVTTIDRIYFTDESNDILRCISMTGEEIWVHNMESLVYPRAITVDAHQNVLVADSKSNSVIVIQHDGKLSKILLSEIDGHAYANCFIL